MNQKDIIVIGVFLATSIYIVWNVFFRGINKVYLHYYKYSVPYIIGGIVISISAIGIVCDIAIDITGGTFFFASFVAGFALFLLGESNLAKYTNNERRYKEIMDITKNSAKYLIIALFILILKEWFI